VLPMRLQSEKAMYEEYSETLPTCRSFCCPSTVRMRLTIEVELICLNKIVAVFMKHDEPDSKLQIRVSVEDF